MINIDNGISLVKFAATWCAPCKILAKTLNKIEPDYPGIAFQEVDIDDHPNLAKDYKIRSVPTVIVFSNGEEITRLVGSQKADNVKKALEEVIKVKAA